MLKIAFSGFWEGFNKGSNFIINALNSNGIEFEVVDIESSERRNAEVQVLFYSVFSDDYLKFNCVRIFFTGENVVPDFNLCDYAIGFEHLTYQDRYIRFPLYAAYYAEDCKKMLDRRNDLKANDIRESFCGMVVSNGNGADDIRDRIFDELSKYKKVDSGGRYRNNIGKPEGVEDKEEFLSKYKFSICFENVSHPGYCTEKIVQAFAAGTVPIYWGDPLVGKYFNPKSFVNCNDFESIEKAVEYVIELDKDNDRYLAMLNEPAVIDEKELPECYVKEFDKWIGDILKQPYEQMKRRNDSGRTALYESRLVELLEKAKQYDYEHQQMSLFELVKNRIKENKAK